ncbi:hypothetical protein PSTG_14719 [Puccinia striiformis f. sp. tritici PST-78]|uniref:Uncharacterized protein n=1 Tax=Puccinia striiformis f. sp. tritici PST-78 TaxID=1165861 RepID=A0A0L0UXW8_9BASI|nr:hypothetical protein PSTG_14719 [Puccinia striiformis f. sp. tritici PST-78]
MELECRYTPQEKWAIVLGFVHDTNMWDCLLLQDNTSPIPTLLRLTAWTTRPEQFSDKPRPMNLAPYWVWLAELIGQNLPDNCLDQVVGAPSLVYFHGSQP